MNITESSLFLSVMMKEKGNCSQGKHSLDRAKYSLYQRIYQRIQDAIAFHLADNSAPQMQALNILPVIYSLIGILQE